MKTNKKSLVIISVLAILVAVGALFVEILWGLSLLRGGFHHIPVKDMYLIITPEKEPYLSIDIYPGILPFTKLRVAHDDVALDVNPSIAKEIVIDSNDKFIWGSRWPWVEKVTLTLKADKQRKGFESLFNPEKLKRLQREFRKGEIFGITSYGLLTMGGRFLEE